MAGDSHPIRNGIVATVVGGLLLSLLLNVINVAPFIWDWITSALSSLVGLLFETLAIPVWLLLLLVAAAILVVKYERKERVMPAAETLNEPGGDDEEHVEFSDLEIQVLEALVAQDGGRLYIHEISDRTRASNIRVQRAIETLGERGLVAVNHNYLDGPGFYLTSTGRAFVIESGMA